MLIMLERILVQIMKFLRSRMEIGAYKVILNKGLLTYFMSIDCKFVYSINVCNTLEDTCLFPKIFC